jgi:hypothetical protein
MPYETHPAFIEPKDRNARLWRYMDFARFLSILDKRALFFPSIATLSAIDPYEGEPAFITLIDAARSQGADELRRLRLQNQVFGNMNFFSCWHMNDSESDAMWKLYLKSTEGVAILSTVGGLMACFHNTPDTVYMGEVQYIDHAIFTPTIPLLGYSFYMFKRLAFQHGREIRVGTYRGDVNVEYFDDLGWLKLPTPGTTIENILQSPGRKGVYVDIDVPELIDKVVVSPLSPDWFSDLVISLSKKLGYEFEVIPSEMSRPPALWEP